MVKILSRIAYIGFLLLAATTAASMVKSEVPIFEMPTLTWIVLIGSTLAFLLFLFVSLKKER